MSKNHSTKRSHVLLSFLLATNLAVFGTASLALAEENGTHEIEQQAESAGLGTQEDLGSITTQKDDRWNVDGKTLTIGKDGEDVTFETWESAEEVPWHDVAKDIETVEVKGNVTVLTGSWMFQGFENLQTLDLSNLKAEGVDAKDMFSGCKKLAEIKLPGSNKFKLNKDLNPAFPISVDQPYTGKWSNGSAAKSADDLYALYTEDQADAQTWKWQQKVTPDYSMVFTSEYTYNGKEHTPKPTVTVTVEEQTLVAETDYTVSSPIYANNVEAGAGTATVTVTPTNTDGYYVWDEFTTSAEFTIKARPITLTVTNITKEYDGYLDQDKQTSPAYSVTSKGKVSDHKVKVSLSTTYKKGENNNVGSYKVSIAKATITDANGNEVGSYSSSEASTQATNNYAFTVNNGTLKITAKDINPANKTADTVVASISAISDRLYTGKEIEPLPVVKMANTTLKKDDDYTLSYKNNKDVGTATVTVTGKGNYTGTKDVTFNIKKQTTTTTTRTTATTSTSRTPSTSDSTIGVVGIVVVGVGIVIAALVLRRRKSE